MHKQARVLGWDLESPAGNGKGSPQFLVSHVDRKQYDLLSFVLFSCTLGSISSSVLSLKRKDFSELDSCIHFIFPNTGIIFNIMFY